MEAKAAVPFHRGVRQRSGQSFGLALKLLAAMVLGLILAASGRVALVGAARTSRRISSASTVELFGTLHQAPRGMGARPCSSRVAPSLQAYKAALLNRTPNSRSCRWRSEDGLDRGCWQGSGPARCSPRSFCSQAWS
eukprot:7796132-Pyramimonas_sp.AAC.1